MANENKINIKLYTRIALYCIFAILFFNFSIFYLFKFLYNYLLRTTTTNLVIVFIFLFFMFIVIKIFYDYFNKHQTSNHFLVLLKKCCKKIIDYHEYLNFLIIFTIILSISIFVINDSEKIKELKIFQEQENNKIIKQRNDEIKFLRQMNMANLEYAISTLNDLKNENKIIEYKIIATGKIITLKMVQFWNDFEVDVYILNFDHITQNYDKNIAEAYIATIDRMKAVNNVNNYIGGLWMDRYKFSLNNRNEIKAAIARSQEDLYNWSQDVCNSLSVVIISNQHRFYSVLNKRDLDIIKEICENNLCGEDIKKAVGGDCNNIYHSDVPFLLIN